MCLVSFTCIHLKGFLKYEDSEEFYTYLLSTTTLYYPLEQKQL